MQPQFSDPILTTAQNQNQPEPDESQPEAKHSKPNQSKRKPTIPKTQKKSKRKSANQLDPSAATAGRAVEAKRRQWHPQLKAPKPKPYYWS
jgi:hypothetical protein